LELSKLEKIVEKPTNEMSVQELWAVFFRYLTDRQKRSKINEIVSHEEGISLASEVLMTVTKDEIERARQMQREIHELDLQSMITGERKEARREGENKGKKEIVDLLKSGKSPEEIIAEYDQANNN
jgi:hypothetical protein